MKMSVKVALTTVGVAVLAFFAGPLLFTPAPEVDPSGVQLGLLMGVMAVESVALGLGVAFLIFGWPLVRRVVGPHRGLGVGAKHPGRPVEPDEPCGARQPRGTRTHHRTSGVTPPAGHPQRRFDGFATLAPAPGPASISWADSVRAPSRGKAAITG